MSPKVGQGDCTLPPRNDVVAARKAGGKQTAETFTGLQWLVHEGHFDAQRRACNSRPLLKWERRRARYVLDETEDMDVRSGAGQDAQVSRSAWMRGSDPAVSWSWMTLGPGRAART